MKRCDLNINMVAWRNTALFVFIWLFPATNELPIHNELYVVSC